MSSITLLFFPGAATLLYTVAMLIVYCKVRKQEQRTNRYKHSREEHSRMTKRIKTTLLLYTGSFYNCFAIPVLLWSLPHSIPALHQIGYFLFPLQGFFNMMVFIQPKCHKYKKIKNHPGTNMLTANLCVVFHVDDIHNIMTTIASSMTTDTGAVSDTCDGGDGIGFNSYNEEDVDDNVEEDVSDD
mmetsp:Transcript_8521/g.14785  ORF Transcript_8521/g.14785 Transcript_8521/m.14785 type:complete len:185 (+) Transcript_8521:99-653(+)